MKKPMPETNMILYWKRVILAVVECGEGAWPGGGHGGHEKSLGHVAAPRAELGVNSQ